SWYVEKREQQKTFSTIFGNVEYIRTYYKNWCETGADQMARLRVLRENGGKVYEIIKQRDLEREKEKRIGKKTWACEMLKTFRGA
ncbi:MAG TPA: hypothetical protein DHN33_01735, partial [Eubacteriaceae bacterium]|nr:hypothetical protein [Eubacteriaceae bacterium]